jgi:hypothetical protein
LRKDFWFHHPFRVPYAEVYAQSVLFNAHYLTYFDTAITEYFRTIGYDYYGDVTRTGIDFHAVRSLGENWCGAAANTRYKHAPPHSITSSALARSVEVIVRPSAGFRTSASMLLRRPGG